METSRSTSPTALDADRSTTALRSPGERRRVRLGLPIAAAVLCAALTSAGAWVEGAEWYLIPLLALFSATFIGGCSIAFAYDMARSADDNPSDA